MEETGENGAIHFPFPILEEVIVEAMEQGGSMWEMLTLGWKP
jgi:hypothetical protein